MSARPTTAVLGEFVSPDALLDALAALRARGFTAVETYTPFEVPGLPERLGLGRSRLLPWLVFGAGVAGAVVSYGVQWYANVWSYPQNAGGRPPHAVPAFILSTFEGMILLAALAAFLGFLITAGLPRLWHPVFEVDGFDRASTDRFWVEVRGLTSNISAEHVERLLTERGATRVVPLERGG